MICERKFVYITTKGASRGYPIKFKLHWDNDTKKYVLCLERLFGYDHFSIEECEDMIKILKEANKEK